jgi:hypothetical protein
MKALGAVQHARPEHGLGLGHVVAEEEDRVGVFHVAVRARLPVRSRPGYVGGSDQVLARVALWMWFS